MKLLDKPPQGPTNEVIITVETSRNLSPLRCGKSSAVDPCRGLASACSAFILLDLCVILWPNTFFQV
jgi:hypothetical protein